MLRGFAVTIASVLLQAFVSLRACTRFTVSTGTCALTLGLSGLLRCARDLLRLRLFVRRSLSL